MSQRLSGGSPSNVTPERESAVRIVFNKTKQFIPPWFHSFFKFAVIFDYCKM